MILPETEIHIWQASLDLSPIVLQRLAETLSMDERERANRFRFPRDRRRFIASRGILRAILGRYLNTAPTALQFCYGSNGKPALANASKLAFNLSHSEDLMLCAIAHHGCLGIDLEYLRPVDHLESLVQRFFAPQEYAAIFAQTGDQQLRSFFQHWTCKEALLKAIGAQLMALSTIEVCVLKDTARLIHWGDNMQASHTWSLHLFAPTPDCVASVAVDVLGRSLVFCQWGEGEKLKDEG